MTMAKKASKLFVSWLESEMDKRKWSISVTARQAALSHPVISDILNLQAQPTLDTCVALAKAFEMPPEEVLRLAGLLSGHPDARLQTLIDLYNNLSLENRDELIAYAEMRYRLQENRSQRKRVNK